MRCMSFSTLALLFAMIHASAGQSTPKSPGLEDPPWVKDMAAKPLVYSVPGMDKVKVKRDLAYKRAGSRELKADVYRAANLPRNQKLPAIIFIHGGFLPSNLRTEPKDWRIFADYGRLVAASGFVGVTFNHRLYDNWASVEDSTSDLKEVIAYVRNNADSLGVDKDRIALWAFSGGGPLLSLAIREPQPYIRCIVSYYAVLDLMNEESRGGLSDETLRKYSPLQQLEASNGSMAPIFIASMGHDHPKIRESVDRFVPAALGKNVTVTLSNDPQGHHGFDIEDDTEASRAVIRETMEFVKSQMAARGVLHGELMPFLDLLTRQ